MKKFFVSVADIIAIFCMEICAMFASGSTVVLCLPGPMRAFRAFMPFLLRAAGSDAFPQLSFVPTGKVLVATRHAVAGICAAMEGTGASLDNAAIFNKGFYKKHCDLTSLMQEFNVIILDDIVDTVADIAVLADAAADANCTLLVLTYGAEKRKALHGADPAVMPYHLLTGEKVENQLYVSASCNPNAKKVIFDLSEDSKDILDVHY